MGFSYSSAALSEPLNQIRLRIQDTTEAGHFFEDEEILFAVSEENNLYRAAANLCRMLAAKMPQLIDYNDDAIEFDASKRATHYLKLAADYEKKADEQDSAMAGNQTGGLNLPKINTCPPAFTRKTGFQ